MRNIKISIITTCKNSDKHIGYTLSSVRDQTYKNLEHIIVDGGSTDDTLTIIKKHKSKKKIIIRNKSTIYEGINQGIKNSTGDYLLILNSDDILYNKNTIKKIVNKIKKNKDKILLGNVVYFNNYKFEKPTRLYSAKKFQSWMLYFGLMPPHPGAIIHSSIAKKITYSAKYKIAADFDFFLKAFKIFNIKYQAIDLIITRMRTGGISGKNIIAHFISGSEIYNSLKENNFFSSHILINLRYFSKSMQYFFLKEKISHFKLRKEYISSLRYHFKIIRNIKSLNFKKKFVLSALNLAFLGSYANEEVKLYKKLIHWPDGVFVKGINYDIKKIPGREILNKINIPNYINQITVMGNLPIKSKIFLIKKYKKKVKNIKLPFGNISKIIKKLNYKIKDNELLLITLPTPKQEQLAEYLVTKNKFYKIICIGGSINIVSGLEKKVPKFLYHFEFIWRLRYETFRRLKRLLITFKNYTIGKFFKKKLDNLHVKFIN
jgi:glycosyltransferase involved in cell wall biosynthesis